MPRTRSAVDHEEDIGPHELDDNHGQADNDDVPSNAMPEEEDQGQIGASPHVETTVQNEETGNDGGATDLISNDGDSDTDEISVYFDDPEAEVGGITVNTRIEDDEANHGLAEDTIADEHQVCMPTIALVTIP